MVKIITKNTPHITRLNIKVPGLLRLKTTRSRDQSNDHNQSDDDNSALVSRFNQILEDKIADSNPNSSIINQDPQLSKLYKSYSTEDHKDKQFRLANQVQLGLLQRENLLAHNKHAKDIADTISNQPWRGAESINDSNLRMIVDLMPPPLPISKNYNKSIITPPMNPKDRIANAKQNTLDYKVKRQPNNKTAKQQDDDNWRELYQERLLGPQMLINALNPNTTIGFINKLSELAINKSINQQTGQFDLPNMSNVRGKPLDKQHLANSTDSNYFINQILNKQEVLPPWIENQQGLDREISSFRNDMEKKWFISIFDRFKRKFGNDKHKILAMIDSIDKNSMYDVELHNRELAYVIAKCNLINKSIRDYNLQCPSSSIHKFKLNPENELKKSFEKVWLQLNPLIREWFTAEEYNALKRNSANVTYNRNVDGGGSFFGLFDTGGSSGGVANGNGEAPQIWDLPPMENVKIWKSIKDMFKTNS